MAQITVDTDRDSVDSIKKIISLLEHTIAEKGGHVVTNASPSYGGYNDTSSSMPSSAPVSPSNPFAMFDDTPSTTSTPAQSTPTQEGGDIFSVFSDTPPSTSPGSYGSHGGYGSSSAYSQTKSANDLLNEVNDVGELNEYESEEENDEKDFFQLESY